MIQAAQTDITDTIADRKKSVGDDEQKDIKSFQDLDGELTKIAEQAEKKAKSYKTTLSSADYQKLIKYEKALDKYINAVQDYATTLESEGAVQSNPDASSSDKRIAKKDTSQAKQRLDNAKKKWLASYANSTMS